MSVEEGLKTAQTGIALVGEIIKAAGDNEDVRQSGKKLGKAALTISTTIDNVLLPLAAVNFAIDKARIYFSKNFQAELSEKTKDIPEENLTQPKASIAGPALQGLAFSHDENELKEMYVNLLARTMDNRVSSTVHPAFVEIIKQLTAEEARLLLPVLLAGGWQGIVQINRHENQGVSLLVNHILNAKESKTGEQVELPSMALMIDNWIRLGLVSVDYTRNLVDLDEYKWAETRPELLKLREQYKDSHFAIAIQKGLLTVTNLGLQFGQVVNPAV